MSAIESVQQPGNLADDARASALRTLGRVPIPEAVLSCGAADTALWLYARGYDHYAVKTELRGYGFDDARYFADLMRDGPEGARQHAAVEAGRAGDAIATDVPYADDPAAWHAVWSEEARSFVRTILRHRRAGNRDAAKAVRCLLPERLEWRRWTDTLTDRDRRRIAEAEALAARAKANAAEFDAAIQAGEIPDPKNTDLGDMITACLEADMRRAAAREMIEQGGLSPFSEGADM